MEYDKKLPQDYMTVGEMAKKMGVTVRTLQYYDQQGLLSPSAESEGGRRLYTDRDMILLHQILSLKHLGFSLDAIKPSDRAGNTGRRSRSAYRTGIRSAEKNRDAVRIPAGYRGFEDRSAADAVSRF